MGWKFLCSQVSSRRPSNVKHTGLSFQGERCITCFFFLSRRLGVDIVNSLVIICVAETILCPARDLCPELVFLSQSIKLLFMEDVTCSL